MHGLGTVLIVDSGSESREIAYTSARKHGEVPLACSSCGEAKSLLAQHHFRVVFCGEELSDDEYEEVIRAARTTLVVVHSRSAEWISYLLPIQVGSFD